MTDYNDGEWHGWNGGECPVDPQALVDIVWITSNGSPGRNNGVSPKFYSWEHYDGWDIIAFRVVKPAEPVKPADPLADLDARVEKLEAIINAIVAQWGGE